MNLLTTIRLQLAQPAMPARVFLRSSDRTPTSLAISTNALRNRPWWRALTRGASATAGWVGAVVREQGRFLLVVTLLSFLVAWAGTRAVMAGVEDNLTKSALAAARHQNEELRARQDALQEKTAEIQARLEASGTSLAANR